MPTKEDSFAWLPNPCCLYFVCCLFRDRRGRVGRKPQSTASVLGPAITCWSSWSVSFFYFLCRNYRFLFHFPILLARVETGRCPVRRNVRYLDRRQPSRVAFFPSSKFPHGMIGALFLQGVISNALFCPLAVRLLGKWRVISPDPVPTAQSHTSASALIREGLLLVLAFVFLYMFFGYYIAWKIPSCANTMAEGQHIAAS
jgi:hypothetical protein